MHWGLGQLLFGCKFEKWIQFVKIIIRFFKFFFRKKNIASSTNGEIKLYRLRCVTPRPVHPLFILTFVELQLRITPRPGGFCIFLSKQDQTRL